MLFPENKIKVTLPFTGFKPGDRVVRTTDSHSTDNRIYVVQDQHASYYVGKTEISAIHGDEYFMIDSTKIRPVTPEEYIAHCRLLDDDSLDVVIILGDVV